MTALRGVKEIVELGLVAVATAAPDVIESDGAAVQTSATAEGDYASHADEVTDLRSQWDETRGSNGQPSEQVAATAQQWDEQAVTEWEEPEQNYGYQPHDMAGPSTSELTGLGEAGLSDERYEADPYPETVGSRAVESEFDDPAEIARQLANLSPRAAKAVAAAAKAQTPEEREAALAAIEAEDDTVNRGLLLKFLGSVDS